MKILEEPPSKTFIFLLSSLPYLLKKTLLSRLSHIQFKFPTYVELQDYYESQGLIIKDEDFELLKGSNLTELSEKNLNMTRINSRPTKKKLGEYLFFIDFEGFYDDLYVKSVLNNISKKSNWFKLLGSYEVIS